MAFKMYLNYCPRILASTDRSFMLRFEDDFLLLNMEYSANHMNKVDQFQYFCGMIQGALKAVTLINLSSSSYKYRLDALYSTKSDALVDIEVRLLDGASNIQ